MAIGYTELDFVNGSVPALSAANLNHIDEGVKACADQLDAETAPGRALVEAADVAAQRTALGLGTAALAGDASELAKGVVQLGATGVPSATKVPKALGADLVALITAAGYSLSPAEGTASLDGIADGTTYKRVLAAIATALNAGTYDAYQTSGKRLIRLFSGVEAAVDLDTLDESITYQATDNAYSTTAFTNSPIPVGIGGFALLNLAQNTAYRSQVYIPYGGANIYIRTRSYVGGVVFSPWYKIWNSLSDGNGGQPPAPKPNGYDITLATIGKVAVIEAAVAGTSITCPGSTGQAEWWVSEYGKGVGSAVAGIIACGATLSGTTSDNGVRVWFRRIL